MEDNKNTLEYHLEFEARGEKIDVYVTLGPNARKHIFSIKQRTVNACKKILLALIKKKNYESLLDTVGYTWFLQVINRLYKEVIKLPEEQRKGGCSGLFTIERPPFIVH